MKPKPVNSKNKKWDKCNLFVITEEKPRECDDEDGSYEETSGAVPWDFWQQMVLLGVANGKFETVRDVEMAF